MSLTVDEGRPGRSSSPSRSRSRSRSHSKGYDSSPTYADFQNSSHIYLGDNDKGYYEPSRRPVSAGFHGAPYPTERDFGMPASEARYGSNDFAPAHRFDRDASSRHARSKSDIPQENGGMTSQVFKFLPQKYRRQFEPDGGDLVNKASRQDKNDGYLDDLAYGPPPMPPSPRLSSLSKRQDADDKRRSAVYASEHSPAMASRESYRGANSLTVERYQHHHSHHNHNHRSSSREGRRDKSPSSSTLTVDSARGSSHRSRSRDNGRESRNPSPQPPTARMSNLTVENSHMSLASAPASPLLEPYRGTYQNCSPMPSPLFLATQSPNGRDSGLDSLSPLNSDVEADGPKSGRRARFHDTDDIARRLSYALGGDGRPDTQPLIDILPSLTHEQVMELRAEYKRIVTVGSARKGVNVAKHIRARLKDEDGLLTKACYVVALGRWESEAYWANFWYHGDKTRRELLIEALMGRTNAEIRRIKDAFTDKKYHDSLTRCIKTELKEDKFKKAILLALDERRFDDYDSLGRRIALDQDLVHQDTQDLRRAVKSTKGGESDMISIVVTRSQGHLRAVMENYEAHYASNFARDALAKSGNLVGEVLAHILNGVINRPVRDALLLHHALSASRRDELRRELLISRLVRFHWDPHHMQAVRRAYRQRYGLDLQDAVREATSGLWARFCYGLSIARMPDHVRHVDARRA